MKNQSFHCRAGFALLGAYTAAAVALGPLAMAAACRNALS